MALALLSVNCGTPRMIGERNGLPVFSAIGKKPVDLDTVFFRELGILGDKQANHFIHGGPDQAVCVYSADHWSWWRTERTFDCEAASLGENLTIAGVDEQTVGIGDRFAWDDVVLEVTQPRSPCANVDLYHRRRDLAQTMTSSVRCGWYMRVVHEGSAATRKSEIRHLVVSERPSVRDAFLARYDLRAATTLRRGVLACSALASGWRRAVERTLS
jgi:MOSC domain-containing protein YiiM